MDGGGYEKSMMECKGYINPFFQIVFEILVGVYLSYIYNDLEIVCASMNLCGSRLVYVFFISFILALGCSAGVFLVIVKRLFFKIEYNKLKYSLLVNGVVGFFSWIFLLVCLLVIIDVVFLI